MNQCIIQNKYKIVERLGNGSFGSIYKGVNQKSKKEVAIKIESLNAPIKLLKHETTILNYLYSECVRNIPTIFWYGTYGENLCAVMTLYEKSLFDVVNSENLSYRDKIYQIILQCVCGIENIHRKFVIHRDVKPNNIMFKEGFLYFIDFGLSTFYVNDKREHILDQGSHDPIGTPKWMSYYIHEGHRASRRDDLISLGYIFLFLMRGGNLPWDDIMPDGTNEEKQRGRAEKKQLSVLIKDLNNDVLVQYFCICYGLDFEEEPNYYALKDILKTI